MLCVLSLLLLIDHDGKQCILVVTIASNGTTIFGSRHCRWNKNQDLVFLLEVNNLSFFRMIEIAIWHGGRAEAYAHWTSGTDDQKFLSRYNDCIHKSTDTCVCTRGPSGIENDSVRRVTSNVTEEFAVNMWTILVALQPAATDQMGPADFLLGRTLKNVLDVYEHYRLGIENLKSDEIFSFPKF